MNPFSSVIEHAVREAIEKEVVNISNKVEQEAIDKFRSGLADIVASVSLRVLSRVSFERRGQELIIHVKFEDGGGK